MLPADDRAGLELGGIHLCDQRLDEPGERLALDHRYPVVVEPSRRDEPAERVPAGRAVAGDGTSSASITAARCGR